MHAVHMHRLAAHTRISRSVIYCTSKTTGTQADIARAQKTTLQPEFAPACAARNLSQQSAYANHSLSIIHCRKHVATYTYIILRNRASCFSVRPASCSVSALCACSCLRGNCDMRWYVPGFMSGATVMSTQSKSVCSFSMRANLQGSGGHQHLISILH